MGHYKATPKVGAFAVHVETDDFLALVRDASVLAEMQEHYGGSYARFALARSLEHRSVLLKEPLPADVAAHFEQMAQESLAEQQRIEAADTLPFEAYRQRYLATDKLLA